MKRLLTLLPLAIVIASCGGSEQGARTADGRVLLRVLAEVVGEHVGRRVADEAAREVEARLVAARAVVVDRELGDDLLERAAVGRIPGRRVEPLLRDAGVGQHALVDDDRDRVSQSLGNPYYDDPRFAQTMTWWRDMIRKGYMPPLEQARTLGQTAAFQSGKIALAIDGDWTIGTYSSAEGIKVGYAPQPRGPEGSWSMYNGLADAIWVGSKHKPAARKWVNFMASKDCQSIVGNAAVVFPAIESEVPKAVATHKKNGIDVSAFTSYIESGNTILYPITDKAPQINLIVQPKLEEFMTGDQDAATLTKDMNEQVNNVLEFAAE